MSRDIPNIWKDCISRLLDDGVDGYPDKGKWNRSKQKYAARLIAMEARRLDYPLEEAVALVLEWNQEKNDPPVPRDQILMDMVDWVYKQNPPRELGCKGLLVEKGYCLQKQGKECKYWEALTKRRKSTAQWDVNDFDRNGWPEYLRRSYKNGELLIRIYLAMRMFAADKLLSQDDRIMIGVRTIRKWILKCWKDCNPSLMSICSALYTLEDCDLLVKLESGTPGDHSRKSNVYKIIYPVPKTPDLSAEGDTPLTHT